MRLTTVGALVETSKIDSAASVAQFDAHRVVEARAVGAGAARDDDGDESSGSIACALWIGGEGTILRRARRIRRSTATSFLLLNLAIGIAPSVRHGDI